MSFKNLCFAQTQKGFCGVTSFILGSRGFKPSIRQLNCSSVRSAASSVVLGHDNEPASIRLYNRRNPSPIHRRPLILSERLPQNRNRVPFSNGFCLYLSPMIIERPSMPLRRSTVPHASTTPLIRERGSVYPKCASGKRNH